MIQPAAPSVASAIAALAGSPADNGTGAPETGSFAELLATAPGSAPTAPAVATPGSAPALPLESDAELVGTQPILAAPLPLAGKILPGLLPGALPESLPAAPAARGEATATALTRQPRRRGPFPPCSPRCARCACRRPRRRARSPRWGQPLARSR